MLSIIFSLTPEFPQLPIKYSQKNHSLIVASTTKIDLCFENKYWFMIGRLLFIHFLSLMLCMHTMLSSFVPFLIKTKNRDKWKQKSITVLLFREWTVGDVSAKCLHHLMTFMSFCIQKRRIAIDRRSMTLYINIHINPFITKNIYISLFSLPFQRKIFFLYTKMKHWFCEHIFWNVQIFDNKAL